MPVQSGWPGAPVRCSTVEKNVDSHGQMSLHLFDGLSVRSTTSLHESNEAKQCIHCPNGSLHNRLG